MDGSDVVETPEEALKSCIQHLREELGYNEDVPDIDVVYLAGERIRALRNKLRMREECVVCKAALMPPDSPPHCELCFPTDEDQIDYEAKMALLEEVE